ncbi:MAG: thiamine diphosphokinase [Acidimicrobiia bacterium]
MSPDAPVGTAIVVATGAEVAAAVRAGLPRPALVVAADGGVDDALAGGLRVDVAVGDFDSVTPEGLAAVEAGGGRLVRHPVAKDATDLELALDEAIGAGASKIIVLAGPAGRLDHLLANALLLARPVPLGLVVTARFGGARLYVVPDGATVTLDGDAGELVTLLALHGPVAAVRTDGLAYQLHGEPLAPGSSRGVSNVLVGPTATVGVEGGTLLVVLPGGTQDR